MAKTLTCVCGAVLTGGSGEELFQRVEEHIEAEHEASRRTALTAAERKIAALVAEGLTNTQIGVQLGLAEKTVETHLSHVFRKLGIRSREELR